MDAKQLKRAFDCAATICTFLQLQKEYQQEAKKLVKAVSDQTGVTIDLLTLAKFKYLLPEEILFEYHETPYNAELDELPSHLLVFEFADKVNYRTKKENIAVKVASRAEKFGLELERFLQRRSLGDLDGLAAKYLPPQFSFDDRIEHDGQNQLSASQNSLVAEISSLARHTREIPGRTATYGPMPEWISPVLESKGIEKLYSHQSEGLHALEEGKQIVVTTATASGKTLIFQAPVIHALTETPESTSIFIYPTKALAQDQCRSFKQSAPSANVGPLDGDTPHHEREHLRDYGRVLFCNPDILHCTLLPRWQEWQRVLENLAFVIIDEMHSYSGLFGAHVSLIIRRLRRLCFQIGNDSVQFICCSATVDRPRFLMSGITGIPEDDIHHIANDGSPSGCRRYFFMETPHIIPDDASSGRVHPIGIAAPLMLKMISAGLKVIAFCQHRKTCELMMRAMRREIAEKGTEDLFSSVMSYRGGYTAEDRRKIERDMFNDRLKGIVATSALEVGIDIGGLDAVIIVGFPFSLASFRQQVGRVGRRGKDSTVVFVANGSVLDMSYIEEPDRIFNDPHPLVPLTLDETVVSSHLRCSAYELALDDSDTQFFPGEWDQVTKDLDYDGALYHCPAKYLPNPSKEINIRTMESEGTAVIDITNNRNVIIEKIEFYRVGFTIYEGAIYIHQGKPYLVVHLDPDLVFAKVQRSSATWTTRPRDFTDVDPVETLESSLIGHKADHFSAVGPILKNTKVFGYFKVDSRQKILDAVEVDLPVVSKRGIGLWINLPAETLDTLRDKSLHAAAAIHAVQHAMLSVTPKFVVCSPTDLGTECKSPEKEFAKRPSLRVRPARLIIYENYGNEIGNGVVRALYPMLQSVAEFALARIEECKCKYGCASCVAFHSCTEKNMVLSKNGARVVLRLLLGESIDMIPDGPEPHLTGSATETVKAVPVPHIEPAKSKQAERTSDRGSLATSKVKAEPATSL